MYLRMKGQVRVWTIYCDSRYESRGKAATTVLSCTLLHIFQDNPMVRVQETSTLILTPENPKAAEVSQVAVTQHMVSPAGITAGE